MRRSIGEFLAALRKARGYTQQEVADILSVSNRTVSAWERGTALPDILLLPALAELYGVTTDEILAGERNAEAAPRPMLSQKSENKLLKNKLAKFTAQSLILIGIFLAGALLLYAGEYLDLTKIVWSGWQWWLLMLFAGLVTVVVSVAVLIALFLSAQSSADEDAEGYPNFCILLRRRAALFFYLASGTALLCAFVTCGFLISGTSFHDKLLFLLAVCLSVALAMFMLAFFMNDLALKKWGGENAMARRARNGRLYRKTALFGLIPALLAIVCAIVLSLVTFTTRELLYSAGRETFRQHLETVTVDGTGIRIPLSELSEEIGTSKEYGTQYKFNENIYYCFYPDFCTVQIWEGDVGIGFNAQRLTAEDGFFVYQVCEGMMGSVTIGGNNILEMHYEIRTEGETAYYERVFVNNYGGLGRGIGAALLLADLFVCVIVCAVKREKTVIKL